MIIDYFSVSSVGNNKGKIVAEIIRVEVLITGNRKYISMIVDLLPLPISSRVQLLTENAGKEESIVSACIFLILFA